MIRARLILDPPRDGLTNMAVDETLFSLAGESPYPATLRVYGWSRPTVSLGRRQEFSELDLPGCRRRGIDVVKRIGGGGAVYHDMEITYCFVARIGESAMADVTHAGVWRELFCSMLNRLGIRVDDAPKPIGGQAIKGDACFEAANGDEPTVNARKWVGSARRKNRLCFMQHGSILLEPQPEILAELLPGSRTDISIGLAEFAPHISRDSAVELFIEAVKKTFNLSFAKGAYTGVEESSINSVKLLKQNELPHSRQSATVLTT